MPAVFNRYTSVDGLWFNLLSSSAGIECPSLQSPENGVVTNPEDTIVGAVASYICNEGYELSGPRTRSCEVTGEWTSTDPVCNGSYVLMTFKSLVC